MKSAFSALAILALGCSTCAAYDLKGLSAQDILTIGAGLDELPRKVGDENGLYNRIQHQLSEQDAADKAERVKADADARAKVEAEIRKKIEAEKAGDKEQPK